MLFTLEAVSQSKKDTLEYRRHATYFELFGTGVFGSVNHERLIKVGREHGFVRLGAMYFPRGYPSSVSSFPFELGLLKGEHHQFRFAVGATYVYGGASEYDNGDMLQRSSTIYGTVTPLSFQIDRPNRKFYVRISAIAMIPIHEFNAYYADDLKNTWPLFPFVGLAFGGVNKARRTKQHTPE